MEILKLLLWFTLAAALIMFFMFTCAAVFISITDGIGKYKGWKPSLFFVVLTVMQVICYGNLFTEEHNKRDKVELQGVLQWQAQSCPVYKSECGNKYKYACEKKAAVVGRNQVGDIFVNAYPTCQK